MTFKVLLTILLAIIGSVMGSGCEKLDSLPITSNCTAKQYLAMYCCCENTGPPTVVYRDCKDALNRGVTQSGVYTIQPDPLQAFKVFCDMDTDGGGWTVFQRRQDGSVDFYLNWDSYTTGFGDLSGEFWLGLDEINRLTNASSSELRIDLGDFDNEKAYASYSTFQVGNASTNYVLTVSGYSGTAGDALAYHSGLAFSTNDQDHDTDSRASCSIAYRGAWWYNRCYHASLNGMYLIGKTSDRGVNWVQWRNLVSLKFTEMKVRPGIQLIPTTAESIIDY